jgi:plastocyanin
VAVLYRLRYRGCRLKLGVAVLALTLGLQGCEGDARAASRSDLALRDSLGISSRVPLHRIALGGARDMDHVVPTLTTAEPGDVVEFQTVDGRVHTLSFAVDSITRPVRAFLEETRQLSSPPLLDRGSRFLVDLTGAPVGRYVFRTRTSGPPVYGAIVVEAR